jgi:hypothetical protein
MALSSDDGMSDSAHIKSVQDNMVSLKIEESTQSSILMLYVTQAESSAVFRPLQL